MFVILASKIWLNAPYDRPFMPLFALTIYWHWYLNERTNHGHKSTELTYFDSSLLIEGKNIYPVDHNWENNSESNQWHEWPPIVKSNLKSIFVKHPLDIFLDANRVYTCMLRWSMSCAILIANDSRRYIKDSIKWNVKTRFRTSSIFNV